MLDVRIRICQCWLLATATVIAGSGCARTERGQNPQPILLAAWIDFQSGEFSSATTKFERVASWPKVPTNLREEAIYGLATSWGLRRPDPDEKKATEYYRQLITQAPRSDWAAWSWLGLARMKHLAAMGEDADTQDIYRAYQEVIDRFPQHLAADEATIHQQSILASTINRQDAQRAVACLDRFVKSHPHSLYQGSAYGLMAICFITLQDPDKYLWALLKQEETQKVDATNPFSQKANLYWEIATVAEFEAGEFDVARKYYRLLQKEYPVDYRVYAARQSLQRMERIESELRRASKGRTL